MIEKLKTGKITMADIEKKLSTDAMGLQVDKGSIAQKVVMNINKQDPPAKDNPANPAAGAGQDIIKDAAAKRNIEEQRYKVRPAIRSLDDDLSVIEAGIERL